MCGTGQMGPEIEIGELNRCKNVFLIMTHATPGPAHLSKKKPGILAVTRRESGISG
jgi:hypothetical protein